MAEEFVPTELVKKFAGQGKTEGEIILELRNRGFTPRQIDRALKIAIKEEVTRKPSPASHEEERPRHHEPEHHVREPEVPHGKIEIPEELRPVDMAPPPETDTEEHMLRAPRVPKMPTGEEEGSERENEAAMPERDIVVPSPEHHTPSTGVHHSANVNIEELVEAVVAEQMRQLQSKINAMGREAAEKPEHAKHEKPDKHTEEMEKKLAAHLSDLKDALSDLEARTSALEKAFKDLARHVKK